MSIVVTFFPDLTPEIIPQYKELFFPSCLNLDVNNQKNRGLCATYSSASLIKATC